MWKRHGFKQQRRLLHVSRKCFTPASPAVIDINNATFYWRYPSVKDAQGSNPALFRGLHFSLPANGLSKAYDANAQYWAVVSPSSVARTTFLQILAGQYISIPPTARSYPYLSEIAQSPQHAIKYVGFDAERGNSVGGNSVRGAYLSSRYESRREETDFAVHDYLTGHTELNALERQESKTDQALIDEIVQQLQLHKLLGMPVANLSNGQTRRARIAKALIARPEVLLLDGPFMGLDPKSLSHISSVLMSLAQQHRPRLVMSLRPEDGVPDWVSHLVVVDSSLAILSQGPKEQAVATERPSGPTELDDETYELPVKLSRDAFPASSPPLAAGDALVEMRGVKVSYGDKTVLGGWTQDVDGEQKPGLWWSLHRGQRCGIFGPNGSGKTTMLSLITSDHPQTYSLPIKLFGRSRLPGLGQPGISLFDIQKRMGHSSPEVHAFFPKQVTVKRAIESAWADAPLSRPRLTAEATAKVNACLRWFARELKPGQQGPTALEALSERYETSKIEARQLHGTLQDGKADLEWAEKTLFRELGFSSQRLVLFLRAIVGGPDLVILDEALSGIDETTRDKALLFLSHGEMIAEVNDDGAKKSVLAQLGVAVLRGLSSEQALLVISHSKEDVPGCIREWICLPEPGVGEAPRVGALPGPLELNGSGWDDIWGSS